MKKIIYTLLLLGAGGTTLVYTSCKKSPIDGIKLTVDANVIKYSALIQYKDPTGNIIQTLPAYTAATLAGDAAGNIYNIAGKKDYTINGGLLTLGLSPDVTPTNSSPAVFNVLVSVPGYLPVTTPIKLYPGQPQQVVSVTLVSTTPATGQGITFKTQSTALSNNALPGPVQVQTDPTTTSSKQSCKVVLPSGTTFKDVNGNALSGSNLNVVVASFDENNPGSVSAFPGGFSADGVTGPDGTTGSIFFKTAGFTSITMDLDNQQVKQFTQPIAVTMTLDPTSINPNTGNPTVAGDSLAVYSYDEVTAKWQFEAYTQVTGSGSTLSASYPSTHLCVKAFCFPTHIVTPASCTTSITFNAAGLTTPDNFRVAVVPTGWGAYAVETRPSVSISNGSSITLPGSDFYSGTVSVIVYSLATGNVVGQVDNVSSCGNNSVTMTVTPAQVITADLYGICPNKSNQQVRPSFYVYYKLHTDLTYNLLGYVQNGHFSTSAVQVGNTYDFLANYGNNTVTSTQTVTQTTYTENITLPDDICSSL